MSVLSTNIARLSSTLKQRGNNAINTFYPFTMGDNSAVPNEESGKCLNVTDTKNKINYSVVRDNVDQAKLKVSAYRIEGETLYDAATDSFTDVSDNMSEAGYWVALNTMQEESEFMDMLEIQVSDTLNDTSSSFQDALQKQIQYGNLELCMATILDQYRSVSDVSVSKLAMLCDEFHQYQDDDVSKLKSDILTSSTGDSVSAFSIISIIKQSLSNIKDAAAANEVELPEGAVYKYDSLFDMFTIGNIIQGLGAVLTAVGGIIVKIVGVLITVAGWLLSQFKKIVKITQATYDSKVDSGYWNFYLYKGTLSSTDDTPLGSYEYIDDQYHQINVLDELYQRYGNEVMYAADFGGATTYQWYDKDGNVNVTGYIYNCFDPEKFISILKSKSWIDGTNEITTESWTEGADIRRYYMSQKTVNLKDISDAFLQSKMDNATSVVAAGSNYLASLFLSAAYYGLTHIVSKINNPNSSVIMNFSDGIQLQRYDTVNQRWNTFQIDYDLDDALGAATPFANAIGRILQYFASNTSALDTDTVLNSWANMGYEFISLIDAYRTDDLSGYKTPYASWCFDCTELDISHGPQNVEPIYGNKFAVLLFAGLCNTSSLTEYRRPATWSTINGTKVGEDYYSFANDGVALYVTDCYPRKFTYSAPLVTKEALQNFLITVGVVVAVVATAVIASKVIKFKLRRKLEYSGGKQLAAAKDKWASGEITDKEFRKNVKKYNRRARLLGIRTYDPINGWFDYPSASSAADAVNSLTTSWGFGEADNMSEGYDGTTKAPSAATTYQNMTDNLDETIELLRSIKNLIKREEE